MSILAELNLLLESLNIPSETGTYEGEAYDLYAVLTPLVDEFSLYGDDLPLYETCGVRIGVFSRVDYTNAVFRLTRELLLAGFSITDRRYVMFETGKRLAGANYVNYHHYCVDVAKTYYFNLAEPEEPGGPEEPEYLRSLAYIRAAGVVHGAFIRASDSEVYRLELRNLIT